MDDIENRDLPDLRCQGCGIDLNEIDYHNKFCPHCEETIAPTECTSCGTLTIIFESYLPVTDKDDVWCGTCSDRYDNEKDK